MATITREQAATTLHSRLQSLSREARQSATDASATGYGPDLDAALRRMDLDDVTALTLNKQVNAFLIIARYYALARFADLLATRVDTEAYAVEGDRQSIFDNITELMAIAAREAAAYGFVLEARVASQIGSANDEVDQNTAGSSWARGALETGYLDEAYYPYIWPYP